MAFCSAKCPLSADRTARVIFFFISPSARDLKRLWQDLSIHSGHMQHLIMCSYDTPHLCRLAVGLGRWARLSVPG